MFKGPTRLVIVIPIPWASKPVIITAHGLISVALIIIGSGMIAVWALGLWG